MNLSKKLILIFSIFVILAFIFFITQKTQNVNADIAAVSQTIANLKPGEWYEIPNSKLSAAGVIPSPVPPGNSGPQSVMTAWSGGVYDTKREKLYVWGGGHEDYSGNEIYAFDMNTYSWSRIWGPTPNVKIPTGFEAYDSYPDGNPSSRHTYNSLVYVPDPIDGIWNCGGSVWRAGSFPDGTPRIKWIFDLKNLNWINKGTDQDIYNNYDSGTAYDPVTGKIFSATLYDIKEYDFVTNQYVKRANISGGWWAKATAAIDPINRKMLLAGFSGTPMWGIFDLNNYSFTFYTKDQFSGNTEILDASYPGLEYNPAIGKFVAWSGEPAKQILPQDAYVIDVMTRTIEKRYPAATNAIIPTNAPIQGTFGRFRYIPFLNAFILVNSIYEDVYIYKLSDLKGDPPGYGSTQALGELRVLPTRYSIGIEWDIDQTKVNKDVNHNAATTVQYRISGTSSWKDALPLMRVDNFGFNMMAGSIFYLSPGTSYEVQLAYTDPDGGSWTQTRTVSTLPLPQKPSGGNIYHVVSGSGGGTGTQVDPFKGINTALAVAQPGTTFLLHAGSYSGTVYFNKAGTENNYIVWQAAGDGVVVFTNQTRTDASYNWFEGITFNVGTDCTGIYSSGDSFANAPVGIVITKNTFSGATSCGTTFYFVHGVPHAKYWYITDNTITGPYNDLRIETYGGEGIDMGYHTHYNNGHTIAYNSISRVGDGISYVGGNSDIFGNDIFDIADDGVEPDYGSANVRIYKNRISMAKHNAISLQDFDNGMPWYVVRNQIISYLQNPLKIRQAEGRFAFYHNTVVNWDHVYFDDSTSYQSYLALYGISKNNILVAANGGKMWHFAYSQPNWKTSIDYNAFDWAGFSYPFTYLGVSYANVSAYSSVSKLDTHSIKIDKNSCFENLNYTGPPPTPVPSQYLNLKSGCNTIDAGVFLPNISDGFLGSAPDIGAYEFGAALPHYGPRYTLPPDTIPPVAPSGVTVR